jgi:DNA-directed RNA polymerase specialized sigma24 family protein
MDSNDFERVFKRNNKRLFLIALSFTANQYDAEDILQNSFMKLLNMVHQLKMRYSMLLL